MTDIYKKRCNDPAEREKWESCGLVRVDSLRRGDVFECIDGQLWVREHETKSSLIHVTAWADMAVDNGQASETVFSPSALVRPVMRKRLFTQYGVEIPCGEDGRPMRDAPGKYSQTAKAMGAATEHEGARP